MKRVLLLPGTLLAGLLLYLLLWPVPIEPVSWEAPVDKGLVDPHAPNRLLRAATGIRLGDYEGPEDATLGHDGSIYATTSQGQVIRVFQRRVEAFADTGGRPLGIEVNPGGFLVVANAYLGLQRIDRHGKVESLLSEVSGTPIYPNNLAIATDGRVFFTEASNKFGAERYRGTYNASLLDIMEHGGHGGVFVFNPDSGETRQLLDDLNYANGIAISQDNTFIVVAETSNYRILKYWLSGERAGTSEVLIDNLPGFPDNLKTGLGGRFWVGLAAPRNELLDKLADRPWLRKVVQRLPAFVRPQAVPSSHVVAFDADGQILMDMQDPDARFPTLTGVLETQRSLYLTTLFGHRLPVIVKNDL